MWRDFVSLISMLCGAVLGGYAALNAYYTIVGSEGVSRRGNPIDSVAFLLGGPGGPNGTKGFS